MYVVKFHKKSEKHDILVLSKVLISLKSVSVFWEFLKIYRRKNSKVILTNTDSDKKPDLKARLTTLEE